MKQATSDAIVLSMLKEIQFGIAYSISNNKESKNPAKTMKALKDLKGKAKVFKVRIRVNDKNYNSEKMIAHIQSVIDNGFTPIIFSAGEITNKTTLKRMFRFLMQTYGAKAEYQVGNEPTHRDITVRKYVEIVKSVSEVRDKKFPKCKVIMAALSRGDRIKFFGDCLNYGILKLVDAIALNCYKFINDMLNDLKRIKNMMRIAGYDNPIYITEMGLDGYPGGYYLPEKIMESDRMKEYGRDSYGGGTEEQQAVDMVKWITQALSLGVTTIIWSRLYKDAKGWTNERALLRRDDYSRKPAFYTFKFLNEKLSGIRSNIFNEVFPSNKFCGKLFHNFDRREKIIIFWNLKNKVSTIGIPSKKGDKITIYDFLGNKLETHNNKATVYAQPIPVIVEVE
jgi:hypothetical protein